MVNLGSSGGKGGEKFPRKFFSTFVRIFSSGICRTFAGTFLRQRAGQIREVPSSTEPRHKTWKQWVFNRDGHADIFSNAHQCVCRIYPTYVGYSVILSDNAEVDADNRIRMANGHWPSLVGIDLLRQQKRQISFKWKFWYVQNFKAEAK